MATTHRSEIYGNAIKLLDELPEGSVVLDSDGDAWQKQDVRWTSVVRGANTELMGSNSLAILTPLTVVHRGFEVRQVRQGAVTEHGEAKSR
ncbi:hypothetical protein [Microbacterium galbinum]|uniref:hypothetical protein n=1 Tax=Microbacterium galbinum TaxID=2851646 RepID=UPI001FFD0357|nr:hypothetical protein [Microbacterium galbinum]MCK2031246.1 hypothetical protein [Microbacterium galbinum]